MGYPHRATDCAAHHDLVRDFGGPRPTITVLCGSTRFLGAFQRANLKLTLAGHIVLSIGCDTKSDTELALAGVLGADVKPALDELHLRKIDLADEVYVLNVATPDHPAGYIGESTAREIAYAENAGKPIWYLTPIPPAQIAASAAIGD